MTNSSWRWTLAMVWGWTAAAAFGFNSWPRVECSDLFRARQLKTYLTTTDLAVERVGKPWVFSEQDRCNFTYFSREAGGANFSARGLSFKTTGDKTVIGWGNYDGRQAKAGRIKLFSGWNEIELKVKQSAASSVWKLELWADGKSGKAGRFTQDDLGWWASPDATATLKGTEPQVLRFKVFKTAADGFGLTLQGPVDNTVEIQSIKVVQTRGQGCFRKEFELPRGKVWRAVAEMSRQADLLVNGRPVAVADNRETTAPVDLTPFLHPGKKNVVCLFARQSRTAVGEPLVYLQGRVVMSGGEAIVLDTDRSWKGNGQEVPGWTAPDFDAGNWAAAAVTHPRIEYAVGAFTNALEIAKRRWPAYDGRLLLENPGRDPQLYFDEAAPVRVNVRLPEGLAPESPKVRWVLRHVGRENDRRENGRGVVEKGERRRKDLSLVYTVDAGKLESGVYTLEAALEVNGKVLERRIEEPLMVVGRLPMKEVAGNSYEEGMDLELEDVIDFTDPDDPHRWIESVLQGFAPTLAVTQPGIVRKDGLVYRQVTHPEQAAMFSYRFEFRHPFSFYLMVLEYPNDARRWTGVSITSTGREHVGAMPLAPWRILAPGWNTESNPSVITGEKYPLDNKMHELKWVHYADQEIHTVDIVNLKKDLKAAAARLWIYHIRDLPALKVDASGERFFGIHTENARNLGRTFGDTDGMDVYQRRYDAFDYDMVARFTQRLRWYFDTCRNYTAYLRFTGQNVHVMGAYQYDERQNSYVPPERMPGDGRLLVLDIRETALRFFERNGITMYSMVEYMGHKDLMEKRAVSDAQAAEGADTIAYVSKNGKQSRTNPNHPAVEAGYLRVVDDLATKFAFSPAWKGIYYCVYAGDGGMGPAPYSPTAAPLDYDYSDATMAVFERETGIKVPADAKDPNRFNLRYQFLTSPAMKEKWIDWRCRNAGSYMTKTLALLRKYRPDLNVLYGNDLVGSTIRYWLYDSGKSYRDYMRQLGLDPAVVRDDPRIWFGRYVFPMGPAGDGQPHVWEHDVGPEPLAYYDNPRNRMVSLCTVWHELPTSTPGWRRGELGDSVSMGTGRIEDIRPPDWPMPYNVSLFISRGHGDNVLESYTQAMIGADPDILLYGFTDWVILTGWEQHMREVAKVITPLPKDKFEPVQGTTDFRHNLAIRALRKGRDYWFYVANPGCWPITGRVVLTGKSPVVSPGDGRPVFVKEEGGRTVVPVSLRPYGLAAFKARGNVSVASWTNDPLDEKDNALLHMKGIIREVNALLEEPKTMTVITPADRVFMKTATGKAAELLGAGRYAAAWSELTNWRFWALREKLVSAKKYLASLPGRPPEDVDPKQRPVLKAGMVKGAAPVIDGRLDDALWREAPVSYRFLSVEGGVDYRGIPMIDTAVQAGYDSGKLYIAMRMADPDTAALRKTATRDNPWQVVANLDDTVLMFLNAERTKVLQLAVNAAGVRYGAWSGTWRVKKEDMTAAPWESAVAVGDGEWVVEAAIPFASLNAPAPKSGDCWRANFVRRFRQFMVPEIYWAQVKESWGDTERYGMLEFQGDAKQ